MNQKLVRVALAALILLPMTAGCASRRDLDEARAEVVKLREQRTKLGRENDALNRTISSYEAQLQLANQRINEQPPLSDMSSLTDLGMAVTQRGNSVVISIPSEITFASGKAELSSSGKNALKAVAAKLGSDFPDGTYWIEGHTDDDPISKSSFRSNRELSIARAMAVLRGLVDDAGVADDQCVVAGFGEYWPEVANSSAANKAKNRRVELVVHQPRADS